MEIKGVIISTQVYASVILEPGVLGLPALQALRAIIDLAKEELLVKKSVEESEFASVPKTRRVLLNRMSNRIVGRNHIAKKSIRKFKREYGKLVGGK